MTTLELVLEEDVRASEEDDYTHWCCPDCYPIPGAERAFCGVDLSDATYNPNPTDDELNCPMCGSVETCPKCDWGLS